MVFLFPTRLLHALHNLKNLTDKYDWGSNLFKLRALLNYGGKSDVIVAVDLLYTMANN